jgi:hypothetical protein
MSPIPGEPLDPKAPELTTSDGRKFKIKVPGLAPPPKPRRTEERGSAEPPRDDPRPPRQPQSRRLLSLQPPHRAEAKAESLLPRCATHTSKAMGRLPHAQGLGAVLVSDVEAVLVGPRDLVRVVPHSHSSAIAAVPDARPAVPTYVAGEELDMAPHLGA